MIRSRFSKIDQERAFNELGEKRRKMQKSYKEGSSAVDLLENSGEKKRLANRLDKLKLLRRAAYSRSYLQG